MTTTDHEKAKRLREREIRALELCTCRYPLVQYRYRNGPGLEPGCAAENIALGLAVTGAGD